MRMRRVKFVRLLELGLVLRWEKFPGFREAFDPADINWGQDPAPFLQQIADIKQGVCFACSKIPPYRIVKRRALRVSGAK